MNGITALKLKTDWDCFALLLKGTKFISLSFHIAGLYGKTQAAVPFRRINNKSQKGMKPLCSLAVRQQILLYLLPDGSRVNRGSPLGSVQTFYQWWSRSFFDHLLHSLFCSGPCVNLATLSCFQSECFLTLLHKRWWALGTRMVSFSEKGSDLSLWRWRCGASKLFTCYNQLHS